MHQFTGLDLQRRCGPSACESGERELVLLECLTLDLGVGKN